MKKSFRLMNAPVIETNEVITIDAIKFCEIPKTSFLNRGVVFIMSKIIVKNIKKTRKKTMASFALIAVDSFFKFNPKKPPINFCQTGEMIIVSFQGFASSEAFFKPSFISFNVLLMSELFSRANAAGINIRNRNMKTTFLFIDFSRVFGLNNLLATFKSFEIV